MFPYQQHMWALLLLRKHYWATNAENPLRELEIMMTISDCSIYVLILILIICIVICSRPPNKIMDAAIWTCCEKRAWLLKNSEGCFCIQSCLSLTITKCRLNEFKVSVRRETESSLWRICIGKAHVANQREARNSW